MEKKYGERMSGTESQKLYVIRFLKKARRRLSLIVLVNTMIRALAVGFLVGAVINAAALFIPIYGAFRISWFVLLAVCVIGFLYAYFLDRSRHSSYRLGIYQDLFRGRC